MITVKVAPRTRVLCLAAALFTVAGPRVAQAVTVNIVSGPLWTATDANGNPVGNAQNVCLNANAPLNCPAGATLYGYPGQAWVADLSSIPGATWIWAPNVTGSTVPAANAEFTFQTVFYLCGSPTSGTVFLGADNNAEVFINGTSVAQSNSSHQSMLLSVAVSASLLHQGQNFIEIKARNGLNPPDCGSGEYRCNPAGVVFGASFADALSAWPTCSSQGKTYTVGQFEPLPCPPGLVGSASRPCICVGSNGFWGPTFNGCVAPPKTCSSNGMTYSVGQQEPLSCPPGRTGSAFRTCQSDGTWTPANLDGCRTPPTTCTSNGMAFAVGQKETLPCTAPKTGSAFRTCQSNGSWSSTDESGCTLPSKACGDICWTPEQGYIGTCSPGVDCASRRSWVQTGINQSWQPSTVTRDWYCCDWNYVLGQSCSFPAQCASGACDIGWGTSNTRICVPKAGRGNVNDWCSNNNQCASGRCGGLNQDVQGAWHAGHCSTGKSALGEFCSLNTDCTSGSCDRGDGTSKTSKCMPQGGAGRPGEPCSHPNQCANRDCVGLQLVGGVWQPGRCN